MTVKVTDIKATAVKYNEVVFWPNSCRICKELVKAMNDYCNQNNELRVNWVTMWDKLIIDSVEFKGEVIYSFDSYLGIVYLDTGVERVKLSVFRIPYILLEATINNFEFVFHVDESLLKYHGTHAIYTFKIIKGDEEIYSASENAEDVWQSLKEYEPLLNCLT